MYYFMEKKQDKELILKFNGDAKKQLKELTKELKAQSETKVVMDSLSLMKDLKMEVRSGSEIIIKSSKETKKLIFP